MAWSLSLFYGPQNNRLFEQGQRWTATLSANYTSGTTLNVTGFNSYSEVSTQLPDHLKVNDFIEIGPSTNASYVGVSERKRVVSATATTITIDSALTADYDIGDSVTGMGTALPEYWKKLVPAYGNNLTGWSAYRGVIYYPLNSLNIGVVWNPTGRLGHYRDTGFGTYFYSATPPGYMLFATELDPALALLRSAATFGVSVYSKNYSNLGTHSLYLYFANQTTSYLVTHGVSSTNHTTWTQYTGTRSIDWTSTTEQYLYLGTLPVTGYTSVIFSNPVVYSLAPISTSVSQLMVNNPTFGTIWHQVRSTPSSQPTSGGGYTMVSEALFERYSLGGSFFTTYTDYEYVEQVYDFSRRGQQVVIFHDVTGLPNPLVGSLELGKVVENHWDRTRCSFEMAIYET